MTHMTTFVLWCICTIACRDIVSISSFPTLPLFLPYSAARFAFVEFDSHRAAAMARRKLMNGRVCLWGHQLAVDWAEPELEVDEEIMAQVLYITTFTVGLCVTSTTAQPPLLPSPSPELSLPPASLVAIHKHVKPTTELHCMYM